MTNILLCYPDIQYYAHDIDCNRSAGRLALHHDVRNISNGSRATYFSTAYNSLSDTTSPLEITYDYGQGLSRAVNYIAIAGVDRLKWDGVTTVVLSGSNDGSSYTTIKSLTLSSLTLIGQNSGDYFEKFTASSAYRYFKISYTATGSLKYYTHNKLFFGNAFDFEREPSELDFYIQPSSRDVNRTSGNFIKRNKNTSNKRMVGITWKYLTDAFILAFENEIANRYHYCFIATESDHEVLNNNKLLYCKMVDYEVQKVDEDLNILIVTFEESEG